MLKQLLLFLGSIVTGFGIGLISGSYFNFSPAYFWLLVIGSLVGGGFFLALSIRRTTKPEKITEEGKKNLENNDEQPKTKNN